MSREFLLRSAMQRTEEIAFDTVLNDCFKALEDLERVPPVDSVSAYYRDALTLLLDRFDSGASRIVEQSLKNGGQRSFVKIAPFLNRAIIACGSLSASSDHALRGLASKTLEYLYRFVGASHSTMVGLLMNGTPADSYEVRALVYQLIISDAGEYHDAGMQLFRTHEEAFANSATLRLDPMEGLDASEKDGSLDDVTLVLAFGSSDARRTLRSLVQGRLRNGAELEGDRGTSALNEAGYIIDRLWHLPPPDDEGEARFETFGDELVELLRPFTEKYGLSPEEYIGPWFQMNEELKYHQSPSLPNTLRVMRSIEAARPGICAYLTKEWNIKAFGRYPEAMLIAQYDNREDDRTPYGFISVARKDRNGAFITPDFWKEVFAQSVKDGKTRFLIRVAEWNDKEQFVRNFSRIRRRYIHPRKLPEGRKIGFYGIFGHANPSTITGGNKPGAEITIGDVKKFLKKQHVDGLLEPEAQGFLVACKAGVEGGIRDVIQEVSDHDTVASEHSTNIKNLAITLRPDGSFELFAKYDSGPAIAGKNRDRI